MPSGRYHSLRAYMKVKSVCASPTVSFTVLDSVNIEWLIVLTTQDNVSKGSEFYR